MYLYCSSGMLQEIVTSLVDVHLNFQWQHVPMGVQNTVASSGVHYFALRNIIGSFRDPLIRDPLLIFTFDNCIIHL